MANTYGNEIAEQVEEQVLERSGPDIVNDEQGAAGYILLWLMGVPASLLFVIFLLRGCN